MQVIGMLQFLGVLFHHSIISSP
uniref:Uncharacterized protein n=1 Tax=Arundo donax TaxID=35708 RepID=A0A0A9B803_ARUDO